MLQEVGAQMRYRIWFNRQADPKEAWVVQELGKAVLYTGPGVTILVHCETKLDMSQTPQGWMECSGQLARDGATNFITIRP